MRSICIIAAILVAMFAVGLMAACGGGDPTPAPTPEPTSASTPAPSTPTPVVTAVPTPTPSVTPSPPAPTPTAMTTSTPRPVGTPSPTAQATPEPAVLNVEEFLEQCERENMASAALFANMGDLSRMDPADVLSWGQLAELYDTLAASYEQLDPPEELQDYHEGWLASIAALRDYAEGRPPAGSVIGDILTLMFETLMPASMEIAFDTSKTDAEKQELMEEIALEAFGEFFGRDVVETITAYEEMQEGLPAETTSLLERYECYFDFSPVSALEEGIGLGPDPSFEDDHSDDREGATSIDLGVPVQGMVDYDGDFDWFRFNAQAGDIHHLDAELALEADWTLGLYDSAGRQLDIAISAPIFWEAPDSDVYYLEVNAWTAEVGPYALSASVVADDHGNSPSNPTPIEIGQNIESSVDYNTDLDYFAFIAEEGKSYTITAEPGTLPEAQLILYDSSEMLQDYSIGQFCYLPITRNCWTLSCYFRILFPYT